MLAIFTYLRITLESPPLLFETTGVSEVGVSFGASPTVYLHNNKPLHANEFHVRSLQTGALVSECSVYMYEHIQST